MGYKTFTCPHAKSCGGCEWLAVPYPIQLRRKREALLSLYEDAVKPSVLQDLSVYGMNGMAQTPDGLEEAPADGYVLGCSNEVGDAPSGYRTKAATPFAPGKKGRILSGFYARGTHRITPCDACLAEAEGARETLSAVAVAAERCGIRPYEEDRGRGLLRHAIVRVGWYTDEALLTLVTNGDTIPKAGEFLDELSSLAPQVTTVCQNVNTRKTNAMLGSKTSVLAGPGTMTDMLLETEFEIGPTSFYQTNPAATELLYRAAIDLAELAEGESMLDAYCGIGTIGLVAAREVDGLSVTGVERVGEAVKMARANARRNGLQDRATFVCADATSWMSSGKVGRGDFDAIVMDPPRAGSTDAFIKGACSLRPERIVYVSCNPATQVRDLATFSRLGYDVTRICAVDMFPYTKHAETVAVLER